MLGGRIPSWSEREAGRRKSEGEAVIVMQIRVSFLLSYHSGARNLTFRLFHMDFKGFLRKGESSCFTHFGSSLRRTGVTTHSVFNKCLTDIEFAFVGSRQDDWLLVNKKDWSCHFQSCI